MCSTFVFTCVMAMVPKFEVVFIISVLMFEMFYGNVVDFCLFILFLLFICQWYYFLLFKVNYFHSVHSEAFLSLFHAIVTSVYIMLIFCTITYTFVVDDLSKLFLHSFFLLIKNLRSA